MMSRWQSIKMSVRGPLWHQNLIRYVTSLSGLNSFFSTEKSEAFKKSLIEAMENMTHGVCLYDASDRLLLANPKFCEIYNLPMGSLHVGMWLKDILAASYAGQDIDSLWRERKAFIDRVEPGVFIQVMEDGRHIAIYHQPLISGGWVATYEDITERWRSEKQIQYMAHHDALTHLPNRRLFKERLSQTLALARNGIPCALLCLDLDRFKAVNDRLGHAAGDLLLREVATRIQGEIRQTDIAARLGGDEFAVLLTNASSDYAFGIADRLSKSISQEYKLNGLGLANVGTSIGVAFAPTDSIEEDDLMSYADRALYTAKRDGAGLPRRYDPKLMLPASRSGSGTGQVAAAKAGSFENLESVM